VDGHARRFVVFEEQEVRQRRLGAFDLRGEHRLLADVGVEKEAQVGQDRGQSVESPQRLVCLLEEELQPIEPKRRIGWQGGRTRLRRLFQGGGPPKLQIGRTFHAKKGSSHSARRY